ncbi:GNAT family N-acetyltransferase [Roseomonas sp. KE2513]|uniref:GNAT family N-acetyltransferase n=1 Tax=Roseomonas sp. KE2513 TaxID=2479202 RepID=UPI0018DF26E2|nr:GNAT family N-acetyltransferase [Roseomonas sp. KE2513]
MQSLVELLSWGEAMLPDNVAVMPDTQGQGLGNSMLAFAELAASKAGYAAIRLSGGEDEVQCKPNFLARASKKD